LLLGYRTGILNGYHFPISSGPLEGINNKIGALQRMACGYRNHEYFIAKLYALHRAKFALIGSSLASMTRITMNPKTAMSLHAPATSQEKSLSTRAVVWAVDSGQEVSQNSGQDCACWLAPVPLDPPRRKVREKSSSRRASNKGCLAMSLDRYLQWPDWTGRELRSDKRGSIPKDLDPMLERLQCSRETWLDLVRHFRKRFRVEIGLPTTLQSVSSRRRTNRTAAQA